MEHLSIFSRAVSLTPVLALSILALSACAPKPVQVWQRINPVFEPPPHYQQVPFAVGVFYSPDLKTQVHNHFHYGSASMAFPIGKASVELYDEAFEKTFKKVKIVNSRPPLDNDSAKGLDAVIEPRIEKFSYDFSPFSFSPVTAKITYRFILMALDGEPIASWTVEGSDTASMGLTSGMSFHGQRASRAMEKAVNKFMKGIRNEPDVKRWLESKTPS